MRVSPLFAVACAASLILAGSAAAQFQASGQRTPAIVTPTTGFEYVYEPVAACRAFDTHASQPLTAARSFTLSGTGNLKGQGGPKGGCGVPVSAVAVAMTLTTSEASDLGLVAAYPTGLPAVHTTAVTYAPGVPLAAGAMLQINNHQLTLAPSAGSVRVTGDVTGYFLPQIHGVILSDGTIYTATSRILSATRTEVGGYNIVVDRDADYCAVSATSSSIETFITASSVGSTIEVRPWIYVAGVPTSADVSFNLTVTC